LCEARKRIGLAPFRALVQTVVRLLAKSDTPGAFYRGLRLMAIDGFVLDLPDTQENERVFGRPGSGRAPGAFPQARVLALCETATHVLWRCLIKSIRIGEVTMAHDLLRHLDKSMLLLWDRGFFSYQTVQEVLDRHAHLLARVKTGLIFRPIRHLSDGSYVAKVYRSARDRRNDEGGIEVRIIEYTFDDPDRPGNKVMHRLLTTLLDENLDPAVTLIELYHERWEEELTIDELKTHQRERPVLRSQTAIGVLQEIHGLLLGHYIVRVLAYETALQEGVDPRRISFTATLKILRCRLPDCPKNTCGLRQWYKALLEEIAEEILPDRRNRINPRVIKRKMSCWAKKKAEHRHYPQPAKEFRSAIVLLR
jgi:Fe-S-cluster formation regulator IscX/YfhJ